MVTEVMVKQSYMLLMVKLFKVPGMTLGEKASKSSSVVFRHAECMATRPRRGEAVLN